jgi:DNA adenine methylase
VLYPGGKGKCFQHVINLLPPHSTYIEAHLGGGAVLRNKLPAEISIGVDIDPVVIETWRRNYPGAAILVQDDAVTFLQQQSLHRDDVVYCDPPYLPSTRRAKKVYRFDYKQEDHERLLACLCRLQCKIIISGYPSSLYHDYLTSWNTKVFPAKTHQGVREEKLWYNFEPPTKLHDARYLGDSFRARQNLKRRQQRMQTKLAAMPVQEQRLVLDWLRRCVGEG